MALKILEMLANLDGRDQPKNILDIGAGSGVLSFAAASLFGADVKILATDINQEAIIAIDENAKDNNLTSQITSLRADGYKSLKITDSAPYDLVICNVLADMIIRWVDDAKSVTAPNGLILLSGILRWRQDDVVTAYENRGFEVVFEISTDDWVTMLMKAK